MSNYINQNICWAHQHRIRLPPRPEEYLNLLHPRVVEGRKLENPAVMLHVTSIPIMDLTERMIKFFTLHEIEEILVEGLTPSIFTVPAYVSLQ
jgi:hypothetical protein